MPARAPVPGVFEVIMQGKLDEDADVINRFFLSFTGGPSTNAQAAALAATVMGQWAANISPVQGSKYSTVQVTVIDLTSATAGEGTVVASHVGTRAGTALPAGVCLVLKFHVNRRYRGGHPRMYLYSLTAADQQDANSWNPTDSAIVGTAWAAFIAAVLAAPPAGLVLTSQSNVSYFSGFTNHTFPSGRTKAIPTPRVTPVVDPVVSIGVNNQIGSQRRRYRQSA